MQSGQKAVAEVAALLGRQASMPQAKHGLGDLRRPAKRKLSMKSFHYGTASIVIALAIVLRLCSISREPAREDENSVRPAKSSRAPSSTLFLFISPQSIWEAWRRV